MKMFGLALVSCCLALIVPCTCSFAEDEDGCCGRSGEVAQRSVKLSDDPEWLEIRNQQLRGEVGRALEFPHTRSKRQALTRDLRGLRQIAPRIFGGKPATGQFPYCVAVFTRGGSLCSGTLVGERVVVTAAHCAADDTVTQVVIGLDINKKGKRYRVADQIVHERFTWQLLKHDIAILILEKSVKKSDAEPIPLAHRNDLEQQPVVELVGFGRTEHNFVGIQFHVEVPRILGKCHIYGCHGEEFEFTAGGNGHDSCNGDSGGPALVYVDGGFRLAGVTSRAASNSQLNCGDGGIYTRVDHYTDWIVRNAGNNEVMVAEQSGNGGSGGGGPSAGWKEEFKKLLDEQDEILQRFRDTLERQRRLLD